MCKIFLYEGKVLHGEEAHPLIYKAVKMYMESEGIAGEVSKEITGAVSNQSTDMKTEEISRMRSKKEFNEMDVEILYTEKGKPYFGNLPLEFSVTNSRDMWLCAISGKPCGIDIETSRHCDYEKIADRFFKPKEAEYVKTFGETTFFKLWVRREAYGKMTGEGFWGEIPELVNENELIDTFMIQNPSPHAEHMEYKKEHKKEYKVVEIEIGDGIECAVCTMDDEPYPIYLL